MKGVRKNKVEAEDRELVKVVVALPAKAELRKKIYKNWFSNKGLSE